MILGKGILAKAFSSSDFSWEKCIICAAGVSNSSELNINAYAREMDLIQSMVGSDNVFVYFSTVSVFDPSKKTSTYIKHKLAVEEYIETNFKQYIIARLPIVVSAENNENQLFGYIRNQIKHNKSLTIHKNASRYFFDITDVPKAVNEILSAHSDSDIKVKMNVGFEPSLSMSELADIIAHHHPTTSMIFEEKGTSYEVDFSEFSNLVKSSTLSYTSKQPFEMLASYLKAYKNE